MPNYSAVLGTYADMHFPPFTFSCGNESLERSKACPTPGVDMDIIDFVYHAAHIPYTIERCGQTFGHVDDNGTATGCLGALLRGEVDSIVASFVMTPVRQELFTFSVPIHAFTYTVVTPMHVRASLTTTMTRLAAPFAANLWALLLGLLVIVVAVKMACRRWGADGVHEDVRVDGVPHVQRHSALRQLLTAWAMTSMLCMGLYRSFLLSTMVMETANEIPIANVAQLAEAIGDGRVRLLIGTDALIVPGLIETHRRMTALRRALLDHPFEWVDDADEILDRVDQGEAVWIEVHQRSAYATRKRCNVHIFPIELLESASSFGLIFNKNVTYIDKLNSVITRRQSDLAFIRNQYSGEYGRSVYCANKRSSTTPTYLRIETLVSVFIFLVVGLVGGCIALCLEHVL